MTSKTDKILLFINKTDKIFYAPFLFFASYKFCVCGCLVLFSFETTLVTLACMVYMDVAHNIYQK